MSDGPFELKDKISITFSAAALIISAFVFVQTQIDRSRAQAEERPRVGFEFSPYGFEERYGFYINNTGGERALIRRILYTYNNLSLVVNANVALGRLSIQPDEGFRLSAGPNFVLTPGSRRQFYTFSKILSPELQVIFDEYTLMIAADICYCDASLRRCWSKRISRLPSADVPESFVCTPEAMADR